MESLGDATAQREVLNGYLRQAVLLFSTGIYNSSRFSLSKFLLRTIMAYLGCGHLAAREFRLNPASRDTELGPLWKVQCRC